MECKLVRWKGEMWRCTHPSNGMLASEYCTTNDLTLEARLDYCPDFEQVELAVVIKETEDDTGLGITGDKFGGLWIHHLNSRPQSGVFVDDDQINKLIQKLKELI